VHFGESTYLIANPSLTYTKPLPAFFTISLGENACTVGSGVDSLPELDGPVAALLPKKINANTKTIAPATIAQNLVPEPEAFEVV
jgi:hypothetical protein